MSIVERMTTKPESIEVTFQSEQHTEKLSAAQNNLI